MPPVDDRTVLIIEDDDDLAEIMAQILESYGLRAERVLNGAVALERCEQELPAVILLDMAMPVLDGGSFAQMFHARWGHQVPLIVVTAAESARESAARIGAEDALAKPFGIEDLVAKVKQWIALRGP